MSKNLIKSTYLLRPNKIFKQVKNNLGLSKINRLTGPEGKTGPETAGPVNQDLAIIQCLYITLPACNHSV